MENGWARDPLFLFNMMQTKLIEPIWDGLIALEQSVEDTPQQRMLRRLAPTYLRIHPEQDFAFAALPAGLDLEPQ